MAKTYVRTSVVKRQEMERAALDKMYDILNVGEEYKSFGANKIAGPLGLSHSQMGAIAKNLESLGILQRRLEYGKSAASARFGGRNYHWTILMPKHQALAKLDDWHDQIKDAANHPPAKRNVRHADVNAYFQEGSLKERIYKALMTHGEFKTFEQLFTMVRRPNENLDYHNVTHVLKSMQQQGQVTYKSGSGNQNIPYDIRITKHESRHGEGLTPISVPASFMADKENARAIDAVKELDINDKLEAERPEPEPVAMAQPVILPEMDRDTEQDMNFLYPNISKLVKRRETLMQASQLVEDLEPELAIALLESAGKPMTHLEEEAVKLFQAYMECKENGS